MPSPNTSLAAVLTPQILGRATAKAAHESNLNRLGRRIVANYEASQNKYPRGDCFVAAYARVQEAAKQEGVPLPPLDNKGTFGRLWGSYFNPQQSWLTLPELYRGKGAPGAMAWAGLGKLVDTAGIWAGQLQPGAVIQVWWTANDYYLVRAGKKPEIGHSFIFLSYVYTNSTITAMNIADQGFQSFKPLERSAWGIWFGANHTSGERTFIY